MRHMLAYAARMAREADPEPWRSMLFEQQVEPYDSQGERGVICGTRRGGKSTMFASRLIRAVMRRPDLPAVYCTMTKGTSMKNMWPQISVANKRWNLGLRPHLSDGRFYTRQGGSIWLAGCKDKREADKFRGDKFSEFIVDEAGTIRDSVLTYLVRESVAAAMTDNAAPLWIGGTPGPVPQGYYWAISTGLDPNVKQWPTYSWSVMDNPHHRFYNNPEEAHRFRRETLGIEEDDPAWIREFLGQWCRDDASLVYSIRSQNMIAKLPEMAGREMRNILGIDLGYDDETAFVVTTTFRGDPRVFVRYTYSEGKMPNSAIARKIKALVGEYDIGETYIDSGGLGKSIMSTLNIDYGLAISPAEKYEKVAIIRRAQQGLSGEDPTILLIDGETESIIDEANTLLWNEKRKGHKEGMPDHNCDAFLYSYRAQLHDFDPPVSPETEDQRTKREEDEFDEWARAA